VKFSRILFSAAVATNIAFSRGMGFQPMNHRQDADATIFANAIQFSQPVRFSEALQAREIQSVLPTTLTSAELEKISPDILERALFSARTMSAEYLQEVADVLDKILRGEMDLATARLKLKQKLAAIGYEPTPDEEGGLKDLSSDERINLVLNTNTQMAHGYGRWMQGQNPVILDAWPAQELYRAFTRMVPRNWAQRWSEAGGQVFASGSVEPTARRDGRMIALKNTPIWTKISRFGLPYPPFDFNSGMRIRDIDRNAAMGFGLIDRDTQIAPDTRDFNQDLKVSVAVRDEALRRVLEEEGYSFDGGVLSL
jgi:hypothetical protein